MGKAIRRFFSHNFVLKFVSVLFSVILWVIVVNIQNPVSTMTIYNIPIQILNETYFEEQGQIVSVDSDLKLNVTVSGNRSVVEKATPDDFKATIDFLSASVEEGKVRIQVTSSDRKMTITQQSASYVRLHVQNIISKELPIRVETRGEPSSSYILAQDQSEMIVQPSSITIRGPEEWVNQVAEAVVVLNTEAAKSDVSGKGKEIELLNADGEIISIGEEEHISISARMMTQLVVPVYKKFSIKLNPSFEMTEEIPYIIESFEISPNSLIAYGNELKLSPISELMLPEHIKIEKEGVITKSFDLNAICQELEKRISGKVGNLSGDEAVLKVTVVRREEASFKVDESTNIKLLHSDKESEYEILYPNEELWVAGIHSKVESLTIRSFHFEVDVEECKENEPMMLDLIINAPEGIMILKGPAQIQVTRKSKPSMEQDISGAAGEVDMSEKTNSGQKVNDDLSGTVSADSVESMPSSEEHTSDSTEKEESSTGREYSSENEVFSEIEDASGKESSHTDNSSIASNHSITAP